MPITLPSLLDALVSGDRTFVTTIPDKGLAPVIDAIAADDRFLHLRCTREEEAVGLCAGSAFAGHRGVLLTQNSGIGNAINALMSLVAFYELPLLMFVSVRGGEGERVRAQVPMGRITRQLLQTCAIRIIDLTDDSDLHHLLAVDLDARAAILGTPQEWEQLAARR